MTENNVHPKTKSKTTKLFDTALKELVDHIRKVEEKFTVKFPFAEEAKMPAVKLFLKVSEDQEEEETDEDVDMIPAVEEEGEEEPGPLMVDAPSLEASPAKVTESKTVKSKTSDNQSSNDNNNIPSGNKTTSRSKIAQDLKKTLQENNKRKSQSQEQSPSLSSTVSSPTKTTGVNEGEVEDLNELTKLTDKKKEDIISEVKRLQEEVRRQKEKSAKLLQDEKAKYDKLLKDLKSQHDRELKEKITKMKADLLETHRQRLEDAKKNQWCAHCLKPAIYYCCWNTSYCSQDCQNIHWATHMTVCQQERQSQSSSSGQQQLQEAYLSNNGPSASSL